MAYSKTSIKDLPEITSVIIQYCWNDFSTLYSCILVNRLWCRLAIPLLWEDPFSIKSPDNHHFIKVFLSNLNDDDKTKLNDYGINYNLFPLNTLFNYPSFIDCLNIHKLNCSIIDFMKINILVKSQTSYVPLFSLNEKSPYFNSIYGNLLYEIKEFIYSLLIKIFIQNGTKLQTLEIETSDDVYKIINFDLLLQNPNFFCNIRNLSVIFNGGDDLERISIFFKFLFSNCNSISSIYFQFQIKDYIDTILVDYISQSINSQHILYKFLFNCSTLLSLSSLKNYNSLNTIIFYDLDLSNTILPNESFERLNVLESVHILYCTLSYNFIRQIINLTIPFKLRSLFMRENLPIDLLQLLLQKSGNYLENVGFESIYNNLLEQQLLEIKNSCTKIKFVSFLESDENVYSTINIIKDFGENLNYLSINFHGFYSTYDDIFIEFSSIILLNLGQVLPLNLKYLNMSLIIINTNDLEVFLKNSQNTFIGKLLIRCKILDQHMNILPYIEEYIMKKRRVNYLAIEESYNEISYDSPSLKSQAKKFESYNIKVQDYDDLYIQIGNFVKNMY
ncbi:hypothetical protein RclHR1_01250004 [Rhizophagus clarus]|uniref:F-box domain-containing protein n=1 Tax=Rhizophagus clarus TaxID=94130 RepID=A0A2Z6QMP0_9GLOM|nr:hypothetical protein RclHR1_01250004 [Rhizophagus clarus]GES79227.1 hypothetical protein GLOIN_2v1867510 [Rhizophagus clarus]